MSLLIATISQPRIHDALRVLNVARK